MTMHIVFQQDKDGYKKDQALYVERSLARRFCENGIAIPYQTHIDNIYDAGQAAKNAKKTEKKKADDKKAELLKAKNAKKTEKKKADDKKAELLKAKNAKKTEKKKADDKKAELLKAKNAKKTEKATSKNPGKSEKAVKK